MIFHNWLTYWILLDLTWWLLTCSKPSTLMRVILTALARFAYNHRFRGSHGFKRLGFRMSLWQPVRNVSQRQSAAIDVKDHPGGVDCASFPNTCWLDLNSFSVPVSAGSMGSLTFKPMCGLHAQTTKCGTLHIFEESKNDELEASAGRSIRWIILGK